MIVSFAFVGILLFCAKANASDQRRRRNLLPATTEEVAYGELACNANASPRIDTDECLGGATALSTLLENNAASSSPVTIPCGACVEVDYTGGETITLEAGLNVLGRLHFPSTASVVLNTTSVVVQGVWSMTTPDTGNTVTISLYGTDEVDVYPHDQCCSSGSCDSECSHKTNMGSKPFVVIGGQLDIRAIDTNCPSWTTLKKADRESNTFTVDSAFASCLAQGDELLVAYDDERGWARLHNNDHIRYTIAAVNGEDVVVEEDIDREYATEDGPGEPMFATEVATLSRRILFEGREDVDNIGAHSIIFHTPGVVQTIQGVSFKGFGQGGILGRYPIHFHKCGDTPSLVSKNVIRDSHQRCVFIHDTNHVTIENNVAFSNKGHCYATETGSEHDNTFINNLAAASHKLRVPGNGQSDDPSKRDESAAFWIRNMMNTFVGNRVAGCAHAGFWLEMKDKKGNQLDDDSFKDNVAHGCMIGLLTYKQGWIPKEPGHVKNMKIYKNRDGFKFHFTGNVKFTNFVAADDDIYRYGFSNEGVDFEDSVFIGLSDDAKLRLNRDCPYTKEGIYASFNTRLDKRKQIHFKNVEFRNFNCNARTVTWYMDDRFKNKNMGDPLKASNVTFTGTSLESNRPALKCSSSYSQNWFMEDAEGILGPNDRGPGFMIKDNAQMQAFVNNCESIPYNGCSAMCEGACLRLVHIEPLGAGPFHSVTLTNQATQTSFTWNLDTRGETYGKAVLVVPKGTYHGDFKDDQGNSIIASSVNIKAFGTPVCENYVESSDFVFETSLCGGWYPEGGDKLVLNNGFESSSGGTWEASASSYTPGASGDKASALTYSSYDGGRHPALRLDVSNSNSCIRGGTKLGVYFKAKLLNMTDNDSPVDCIPGTNCPSGRFRIRQDIPGSDSSYCNGWYSLPRSIVSWNKEEFNEVSSLFTVPSSCAGVHWTWFFLDITMGEGYPANTVKMIVDDVKVMIDEGQYTFPPTIAPTASPTASPSAAPTVSPTTASPTASPSISPVPTEMPTPMPTLKPTTQCDALFPNDAKKVLLNEGFESYKGKTWGSASSSLYSPGFSGSSSVAMIHSGKPRHRLPAIRLKVNHRNECVRGGMELNISFKAKMLNIADDSPVDCTPGTNCPTARFRVRQNKPGGGVYCNGWYSIPRPTTPWNKDDYNTISTVWKVPSKCQGVNWHYIYFDITQGDKHPANTVKLLVDDVEISIKED